VSDGKPLPAAIVYAPGIIDVALTDKNGLFSFLDVPSGSSFTLKIRATQMVDSGFDVAVTAGKFYLLRAQGLRNYNPRSCPEKDRLRNLYVAALRVRDTFRLAVADQRTLRLKSKKPNKQLSERALNRARYHARRYLDLSALLPDRELQCRSSVSGCTRLDLRRMIRNMKVSARHLRMESLLFNRRLRFEGIRSQKESDKRIRRVRKNDWRAMSLIKQLAKSTFECK
jgi:hypothetical protein